MDRVLDCQFHRRFGVEVELNTLNGIVVKLDEDEGEIPYGADKVAHIISKALRKPVEIHGWHPTHNNTAWIVKPDSSCGIEVCSPILKGWTGLKSLMQVVEGFSKAKLTADNRCSLHVHLNISDLNKDQLASVIAYYIKCEHVIFDSLPCQRKNNRYCQFLGMSDLFRHDTPMEADEITYRAAHTKYYSLNIYHFIKGGGFTIKNNRKQTMEFRVGESDMCLEPFHVKNWIRFLLHFVEMTKNLPLPMPYRESDPWSSLLWLGPREVFKLLKFDDVLSEGLKQVRDWFTNRIKVNGFGDDPGLPAIWSNKGRSVARAEFLSMLGGEEIPRYTFETREEAQYGKKYTK
jgi:hypothetical protein